MPTYHYQCQICGHDFTSFHSISAKCTHCEECGAPDPKRIPVRPEGGLVIPAWGGYTPRKS